MGKLTKAQRKLFDELAVYPGEWAACEGQHERRTANSLLKAGLVDINDELGGRWFDCRLSEAGCRAISEQGKSDA